MSLSSEAGVGPSRQLGLLRVVLTVCLPFAAAYFVSYLFRSVNAVISGRLTGELHLTASDLGLLTAAYFLAFACFQLPLGVLLDRFGPRRVQAVLLVIAAAGALVFSLGEDLDLLIAGRALIGLGVAGCLMAAFKAVSLWFPQERWPLLNGCMLGMGGLGAVAATAPVEAALTLTDWRGLFAGLAGLTLAIAALIFLVVPERHDQPRAGGLRDQLAGLRAIFASRVYWAIMPMTVTGISAAMSIQTLWAGPWLRDVAGLDQDAIAERLLVNSLTLTAGFVFGGLLADRLRKLGIGLGSLLVGGLVIFGLIQAVFVLRLDVQALWPWALFGLFSNLGTVYAYPLLARSFPLAYAGRANTAMNVASFFSVFGVQYAIGGLLDLLAPSAGGAYPPQAYSMAFGLFLGLQALALAWYFLFRPRGSARLG
ncbi:Nitrate/nitrite transporter NarK [Tistlia consotensis]|uniref:Nitrate/nitrite transporter NarK n=1 Tax=Tistlia consotensis USBA 355 TaxID=560819 RepID=A0A1Y6BK18_9PROT|nr:MFS transporter [Tistlia consotensis]SMF11909.1 Nitrate/nitrite transporter NarK [Tistlia consotensis USBA 355]SNR51542.1 Nitrate/nitrite transporter NarK [Tistlia consotensis]